MRRRMAAKIAPMKMPPQRIALVAIVVLLLVGGGAWWWLGRTSPPAAQPKQATSGRVATAPALPSAGTATVASGPEKPDAAMTAVMEQCNEALMGILRERTGQLSKHQDASSQLAYALTSTMAEEETPEPPQTLEDVKHQFIKQQEAQQRIFALARRLDPAHPDIAWLAAEKCFDAPICSDVQQSLLQAEPDNAAAWLRAMTWARARKDDKAVEEAFKRAAATPRYDTHRGSARLAVMEGYAGLQTPLACMDTRLQTWVRKHLPQGRLLDASLFVEIIALAGEQASPFVGSELLSLCKAEDGGTLSADRQAGCVRIYTAMADSDEAVEQAIATRELIGLMRDAPDSPAIRERYRRLQWLFEEQRRDSSQFGMDTNEVASMQETLTKAGRWPPPADWLPKDERARSLILTGRPPAEKKRQRAGAR